ncbi:MAG TPA: hypothetical protein VIN04_07695 [Myxococcota bacterium]
MRTVSLSGPRSRTRARRWDVVVLGSALPGLIAAIRLAMGRLRVLLVEEETSARLPVAVREPFFLAGAAPGGVLDACLRALMLPLIDRRRLQPHPIAYQVILPEARVDLGAPARTAEELVSWGLAKPETARALVRGLAEAAAAERDALLEAQVRALVNVATPQVTPEARARLLGCALEGGTTWESPDDSLLGLLRRRFQSLHGETRLLPNRFELVSLGELAGVAPALSDEVWCGRALVINAPVGPLAAHLAGDGEPPDFLPETTVLRRRGWIALRVPADALPEGMAGRLVRVRDPRAPLEGDNLVRIAVHPDRHGRDVVIVASFLLPPGVESDELLEREVAEAVLELMPFARERVRLLAPLPRPRWDDDLALEDPAPGTGWPGEVELRLVTRPPVYRLAREAVGVLGVEGDCLLGWRAGEAILADLH